MRRPGRRQVLTWLAIGVAVWLAADKVIAVATPSRDVGHWRSVAGARAYREAYDAVMADLPTPSATLDIPTSYGTVRVLRWDGPDGDVPVVLLPGRSSGAPMWAENLPDWVGKRTVYAFDPLGDAGLSIQSAPLDAFDDQAQWASEAMAGLGVAKAHVVGHSFGGANAAILAVHHPEMVASLTLIEPVFVIEPLPASALFWAMVTQLPVPQGWKEQALAELGGISVDEVRERTPMSTMIDRGSQFYDAALPLPNTLSDDQWRSLSMPVRVDIASAKSLAGGEQAATRITTLLPSAQAKVWPGTTHSLPMQVTADLDADLLVFWAQG